MSISSCPHASRRASRPASTDVHRRHERIVGDHETGADLAVAEWVALKPEEHLFTTTICQAEILSGIALLPEGRRRDQLEVAARDVFELDFVGRVLSFDAAAAAAYAKVTATRQTAGRTVGAFDLLIAAIAHSKGATVVTRDIGGFEFADVPLINPWDPT